MKTNEMGTLNVNDGMVWIGDPTSLVWDMIEGQLSDSNDFVAKKGFESLLDKEASPYMGEGKYVVIGKFKENSRMPSKINIEFIRR